MGRVPLQCTALVVGGILMLSGCLGGDATSEDDARIVSRAVDAYDGPDGVTDWDGKERLMLAELNSGHIAVGDCTLAPYPEIKIPRSAGRVLNGTDRIEFRVEADTTMVGIQTGYSVDEGVTTWFETAWGREVNGATMFSVEVDPSTTEAGGREKPRWTFLWRQNYPMSASDDWCYNGASAGSAEILIEAVKGG